jgi:endonuclease YncB( thermonuclease family)
MMDDLIPHPFASILFALIVGALFVWHGFEENRPPKRLAYVRPAILNEQPQAARIGQRIQPVPLRGEAHITPKPTKKTYYGVIVPDSGTLEAGDVVIKLNGIAASKADAQCPDAQGKNWPCGSAAKTALRRLIRARAVVCDLPEPGEQKSFTARCAVSGTDLSAWLVRQGWVKPTDPSEPTLADAAKAAKSERIGLWQEPILVR